MTRRVLILQEYVPGYREPFFRHVREVGERNGTIIEVAAGRPSALLAERGDISDFPVTPVRQIEFSILGRRVVIRRISRLTRGADLVVLEQARRNIDVYRLLAPWVKTPVALWGHGRDFVQTPGRRSRALLDMLSRRAHHVFVYTEEGKSYLESIGVAADRITMVQNSTDSRAMTERIASIDGIALHSFRSAHGLQGRTALYMGGLDASKRIQTLLDAAPIAHAADPRFVLLIAGDGTQRPDVQRASNRHSFIRYLGPIRGEAQALALAACDLLTIPGRVGLVAVDSIAAARPIVTTDDAVHAPEFSYLTPGRSVKVSRSDAESYAMAVLSLQADSERMEAMRAALIGLRDQVGVERMAERFWSGVTTAIESGGRGR